MEGEDREEGAEASKMGERDSSESLNGGDGRGDAFGAEEAVEQSVHYSQRLDQRLHPSRQQHLPEPNQYYR